MNTNKSAEVPERLGCGHSKRRPGGTTQPAGEPRAAGLERPGNGPRSLVRKDHRGTRGGRVMAYKSVAVRRRGVSYANGRATGRRRSPWLISGLKPYWGKPAVRNFRGGGGNMPTSPVRPPRRLMDIGLYPARDSVMRLPPTRQERTHCASADCTCRVIPFEALMTLKCTLLAFAAQPNARTWHRVITARSFNG